MRHQEDWRYSEEAQRLNLRIIWECDRCGHQRESEPGCNEGGWCEMYCGGRYQEAGESHDG